MLERMNDYVKNNYAPIPESGCWLWMGSWDQGGYGKLSECNGKTPMAHKLFYTYHKGEVPDGMCVCHKCDTPACVNPEHLFLGTRQENTEDCVRKNRTTLGRKVRRGYKKLTPEAVREIRESNLTRIALAKKFGVSRRHVTAIIFRRSWAQLDAPTEGIAP